MEKISASFWALVTGILAIAILATLVSKNSATAQTIQSLASGYATILGAAEGKQATSGTGYIDSGTFDT